MLKTSVTESPFSGQVSNGYQQSPATYSVGPGGNVSSMNVQRVTSQMIPTPGFTSSSNQSYMNPESSSNGGGLSTVESVMVSQPQQQKPHIGQNSRILHNLGGQLGSGIRSNMQQKSYGFSNGALNGGLGLMGNNLPLVNEHGASEGYLTGTSYVNSPKPLQHRFEQHQRPVMQGTLSLSLLPTLHSIVLLFSSNLCINFHVILHSFYLFLCIFCFIIEIVYLCSTMI